MSTVTRICVRVGCGQPATYYGVLCTGDWFRLTAATRVMVTNGARRYGPKLLRDALAAELNDELRTAK